MILSWEMCQHTVKGWRVVGFFMLIVRIVVPTIIIMTGLVSVYNAVFKGTAEESIKGLKTMFRKIVAGVVVFLIPSLINAVVGLLVKDTDYSDFLICTTCFDKPNSSVCTAYVNLLKDIEEAEKITFENEAVSGKIRIGDFNDGVMPGVGGKGANSVSNKTSYGNLRLNVEKAVETNNENPSSGLGDGRNKYRAVQAAAYTGTYVVYSQNKNYGSIESSSKGGRICWSELKTGKFVGCVEVGSEGGHMDGLAYDCDRGIILKTTTNGKLLQYDAFSRKFLGYANVPSIHVGITYVPKIHMLVGEEGGKFFFYKYNSATNTYERDHVVNLEGFDANAVQGLGTDGTNIFIADTSPWSNKENLYTYSLDGKKLEVHTFGDGFGGMSSEVEAAFADNDGVLYLACPQGIARVTNYTANKIGLLG